MYDGIINVYKEKGFTSHDVVAKMRGILGQRRSVIRGLSIRRRKAFFRCAPERHKALRYAD